MVFKLDKLFLLSILILLQSCSGGRIGNFLESSFHVNEELKIKEDSRNNLSSKKNFKIAEKSEKEIERNKKITKEKKVLMKRKFEPQSYKIILILKDVDPKDPIEKVSNILRNSDVNFEIEKIERYFDSKKILKKIEL